MFSATRIGELNRTAEIMVDIAKRHQNNPLKSVTETLFLLRSTNRTNEKDLLDLQSILDEMLKKQPTNTEPVNTNSITKSCIYCNGKGSLYIHCEDVYERYGKYYNIYSSHGINICHECNGIGFIIHKLKE